MFEVLNFRFEGLDIWQRAISISNELFDVAERAEENRKYRFAEQLNGAVMSITNNIAEGSAASSAKEFARYLTISRNSIFEVVNILHIYEMRGIIDKTELNAYYNALLELSKMIYFFRRNILSKQQ